MREDRELLSSVRNALALLELIGEHEAVGVSEAARRLGVGRSTAHRLLATLARAGFVERDPATRRYRAGSTLASIGLAAARRLDVRRRARPHLETLAAELDETVNLIALEGCHARFLDAVEGGRTLRVGQRVGLRQPAHCNSVGKALLAALPRKDFLALYPEEALPAVTSRTITSRAALEAELAEVRRRGYATNIEESEPDVVAVGAALPPAWGGLAGIGVSIPKSRATPALVEQVAGAVIRVVRSPAPAR